MVLALDNGASGALAVLWDKGRAELYRMADYTKKDLVGGKGLTRLDFPAFRHLVQTLATQAETAGEEVCCYLERPATNSAFSTSSIASAARFCEAQCIALELARIGYAIVSSSAWQKAMLPGVKGRSALKQASLAKGLTMYPKLADAIRRQKDADALLMARYYALKTKI